MEETPHPVEVTEQRKLAPEGDGVAGGYFNLIDENVSGSLF